MEIDNHILGLSMEFERQNIIINEYETEKAKHIHDRNWRKRRSQSAKKSAIRPKSGGQQQPVFFDKSFFTTPPPVQNLSKTQIAELPHLPKVGD